MINTTSDIWKMCNSAHFSNITSIVLIINCMTCPFDYLFILCMTKSLSLKFNFILSIVFNSFVKISMKIYYI